MDKIMSNKASEIDSLSHLTAPMKQDRDTQAMIARLTHELASRELETRFLDALERGEIDGDMVVVDAQGREIKDALPRSNIFEL